MSRLSRSIIPGLFHYVFQRGRPGRTIFEEDADYNQYLVWLHEYAPRYRLDILGYCLVPDQVHFLCVPRFRESLSRAFNSLHMRYSKYLNRKNGCRGSLWRGRFRSAVLDDGYTRQIIRYIENYPVRAGLASGPSSYLWSSARSHCSGLTDGILNDGLPVIQDVEDWEVYLKEADDEKMLETVRSNVSRGRPCGREDFVRLLEEVTDRTFIRRGRGRPPKKGPRPPSS